MLNNSELRNQAKILYKAKNYNDAIPLYAQIYCSTCDRWIAWEYAQCFKGLGKLDEALEISKKLYQREANFEYNNNLLSWILYEKYFKVERDACDYIELNKLYEIANFVINSTTQNSNSSYEKTITMMLKLFKKFGSNVHAKVITLLDKLDVSKLSGESGTYIRNDRDQEFQSPKEMYYAYKTRALLYSERFKECAECCDEAIKEIGNFHHDNYVWIMSRKAKCLAHFGKNAEAIIILKNLITRKEHFSLFEDLGEIYLTCEDKANALICFCRAACVKGVSDMKVSLFFKIAKLLHAEKASESAWAHILYTKQIRDKKDWKIPRDMQVMYEELSKIYEERIVEDSELKSFWVSIIHKALGSRKGVVNRINNGGKTGFIKSGNDSFFFKISSLVDKGYINQNDDVLFVAIDSYNSVKNETSKECAYIKFDK